MTFSHVLNCRLVNRSAPKGTVYTVSWPTSFSWSQWLVVNDEPKLSGYQTQAEGLMEGAGPCLCHLRL